MSIYQENGFENREQYLCDLAHCYGMDEEHVKCLADALGPSEDFDGLVSTLEDFCQ